MRTRRRVASRLRRSLSSSVQEGLFAEVFNACAGPTILVGWALRLGCTPVEVGLVGTLPQFAQVVQLPAAWATAILGGRRVALFTVTLSRQAYLPLALLAVVPVPPQAARALLLGVAAASAALGMAGNHAWTAWMGELVPDRIRGRYFGRRTAVCVLGGSVAAFATARILDGASARGVAEAALALLALASSAVGAVTSILLARQHAPPRDPAPPPRLVSALRPLADPAVRAVLVYQVAWNASVGLAGGYFTFYLLDDLRAGFTIVALHAAGAALGKTLSAPFWGHAVDRLGARPVLATCSFAAAGLPLLWLAAAPGTLWPIAVDAALGGVAWGGHGLASFAMPLAVAPRRDRTFYLAAFSIAGGAAFGLAAALAGALVTALPRDVAAHAPGGSALGLVFLVSAGGRLASAFLALNIEERDAGTLGELNRMARGAARAALAVLPRPYGDA